MKILNIMLSRTLGGIQQAFLDYDKALSMSDIEVINITAIGAKINDKISPLYKLCNLGSWDISSAIYLWLIVKSTQPDMVICHGRRAIDMCKFLKDKKIIGVAHNYGIKSLKQCDYVIALTKHMQQFLLKEGIKQAQIEVIPNMIELKEGLAERTFHNPVVIGTMARFVKKKGIDVLLQALAILKDINYEFKVLVGGDGDERPALEKLTKQLGLKDYVTFSGWVNDKESFFKQIDIFCLPSTHEPFGIIVLEAMSKSIPVVATKSEGPAEIIKHNQDGLLCEIDSAEDLAEKIAYFIDNKDKARNYANMGYLRLQQNYTMSVVSLKLANFLKSIVKI